MTNSGMKGTKEFGEMLYYFEKNLKESSVFGHKVERTDMKIKGQFYDDGHINQLFEFFMRGYSLAKSIYK